MRKWLVLCGLVAIGIGSNRVAAQSASVQKSLRETKPLSREVQEYVQKLMDAVAATPAGGDVRGFVEGKSGNLEILLPKAKVFLKRPDNSSVISQGTIVTDQTGRFNIPHQARGSYLVCAVAQGFAENCSEEKMEVSDHAVVLKLPIALKPLGGTIGGRVLLRDGKPAARAGMAVHTSSGTAEVSLFDAGGKPAAGPVHANAVGYYVLTNVKPGAKLELRVQYQGATGSRQLSLTESDLHGEKPFDVVVQAAGLPRDYSPPAHLGSFIDPVFSMSGSCSDESSCEQEAVRYYQQIGVLDASGHPTAALGTLSAWKNAFGFSADPTQPAAGEIRAIYYNNGDLRLGRDMHCRGPLHPRLTSVVTIYACYVTNFDDGHFEAANFMGNPAGGDPQTSITRAESSTSPIATVAMVSIQFNVLVNGRFQFFNNVNFYVYFNKGNADGDAATAAVLDSEGPKAVPGLCIACHGGQYISSTTNNIHFVQDARFLPFDTPSFIFDNQNDPFLEPAQREAFRQMNQVVSAAATTQSNTITRDTIQNLIDGWYSWCGGASSPSCYIDDVAHPFIPSAACIDSSNPATCGWTTASLPNCTFDPSSFYQHIPRVYCRTCHVAHSDTFNWQNFNSVSSQLPTIKSFVFTNPIMPYAEVPYNGFWFDFASQDALRRCLPFRRPPPPP